MPAAATGQATQARPGRCSLHPGAPRVGTCEVCGRGLCLSCAVPVRGSLLGRECLPSILQDLPAPSPEPPRARLPGNGLALAGFALVVVASLFTWSKFGGSARAFGAWRLRWSLAAALGGTIGLVVAALARARPFDHRLEVGAYALLALVSGAGAYAAHRHAPLLSVATH